MDAIENVKKVALIFPPVLTTIVWKIINHIADEAAKNTSGLIENTIKAVKKGSELTFSTQESFKRNVEISSEIGKLVDEIAVSSQEQAQGIGQIRCVKKVFEDSRKVAIRSAPTGKHRTGKRLPIFCNLPKVSRSFGILRP